MKYEVDYAQLIGLVGIFFFLSMIAYSAFVIMESPPVEKHNICYDFKTLNETLETIEDNCGSTFITKRFGDDRWFIFKSNVCDGIKCESKYIPLDKCLNEGDEEW